MKESTERRKSVLFEFSRLGVKPTFVDAVNGKNLTHGELQRICSSLNDDFLLSPGEVGCFLSHRKCWRKLLESSMDWALIGEDDIFFSEKDVSRFVKDNNFIPEGVDVLQMSSVYRENIKYWVSEKKQAFSVVSGEGGGIDILKLKDSSAGTQLYWINRAGAREALAKSEKMDCPVDKFLFDPVYNKNLNISVWSINPFICYSDRNVLSMIEEDRVGMEKRRALKKDGFFYKLNRSLNKRFHWIQVIRKPF